MKYTSILFIFEIYELKYWNDFVYFGSLGNEGYNVLMKKHAGKITLIK